MVSQKLRKWKPCKSRNACTAFIFLLFVDYLIELVQFWNRDSRTYCTQCYLIIIHGFINSGKYEVNKQTNKQNIEIRQCVEQNGTMWCNSICRQTLLLNADMLKFSKIMRIFSRMHFQIKMLNLLEKFIAVHVFLTKIDPNICKALKFKKDKEMFSKSIF